MKYTAQGIADVKNSPDRINAARAAIESMGGKMLSFHVTMGQYDGIVISEFSSDEAAATLLLATGMQGNISTETMRAFTESEYRGIVGNLP
jgi:uncharacterized protein with GYD domain